MVKRQEPKLNLVRRFKKKNNCNFLEKSELTTEDLWNNSHDTIVRVYFFFGGGGGRERWNEWSD